MSRLQKKCLIASGTLHGLLVLIVLTSSAFLLKKEEPVDQQVLTFIPDKLVDAALQRPAAQVPAQAQNTPPPSNQTPPAEIKPPDPESIRQPPKADPPKPQPEPPKREIARPDPIKPKEPPKKEPIKTEPVKLEPKKPDPIKIDLSKRQVRDNTGLIEQKEAARRAQEAKARQDLENRRNQALASLNSLASKLSTPTVGATSLDLGTVGVSYASLDAWIRKVYMDSWQKPAELQAGDFSVMVKVVIRRDGTVESGIVTGPSGISKLDKSVRDVLARVKTIGKEFPEGAREEKRTYTIEFNLKATTGSG